MKRSGEREREGVRARVERAPAEHRSSLSQEQGGAKSEDERRAKMSEEREGWAKERAGGNSEPNQSTE